jgi:3-phenylpropionate/trans-cinnamate dioxygenase ferredoxin subunit
MGSGVPSTTSAPTTAHDGGTLGEGELDDTAVECPRHGGRFDLFSGRVLALPPVRPVSAYETVVDGDEIRVRL